VVVILPIASYCCLLFICLSVVYYIRVPCLNYYVRFTLPQKNVPNIFDCNMKTNYQILIIFGTNIPDKNCHQMTI